MKGRASDSVSRGIAASNQKEEGFIDKLLSRRDLIVLIRVRLKQKVENRVPAIFSLSNAFLASRLDLINPLGALLATRQLGFAVWSPPEDSFTDLKLA